MLCAHDPVAGVDHRYVTVSAPVDSVFAESLFALQPEYDAAGTSVSGSTLLDQRSSSDWTTVTTTRGSTDV